MPSPEVSVVIPAYNEERLIVRTLDAVTTQHTDRNYRVIVVDNNSTDDTAQIASEYPDVTLLQEAKKGTGFAANLGFRFAIEDHRSQLIMRTDADTVPAPDWVEAGIQHIKSHPRRQLVSGLVRPLRDEHYRRYDELFLPASYIAYRAGVTALKRSLWPLRVARGANMAIRPHAYETVGGFPDCSIDQQDDDIELTRRVYAAFGFAGLGNAHRMEVRTSMRRIRKTGYLGLIPYYLNPTSKPNAVIRSQMTDGNIDIR